LGPERGDAPLVEGVKGMAHGLVVAAQGLGHGGGLWPLGTGQEDVTAADHKGLGRPEASGEQGPLVRRERSTEAWCLHGFSYTTCPNTFPEIALGLAAEYCERIVVMHAGHIVESTPVGELFA